MARNNKITIRRSTTDNYPGGLSAGEFAYSYPSDSMFIGNPGGTGHVEVAGYRVFDMLNSLVVGLGTAGDAERYALGDGTGGITLAKGIHLEETPASSSNDTQIATTAYVDNAVSSISPSGGFTLEAKGSGPAGKVAGVTLGSRMHIGITANPSGDDWFGFIEADAEGVTLTLNIGEIPLNRTYADGQFILSSDVGAGVLSLGSVFGIKGGATGNITGFLSPSGLTLNLNDNVEISGGLTASRVYVQGSSIIDDDLNVGGTLDVTGSLLVGGTLDVDGNLIVRGELTTVSTTNLEIEDAFIELSNSDPPTDVDFGIYSQLGASLYTGILYDSSSSLFQFYEGSDDPSSKAVTVGEFSEMASIKARLSGCIVDGGSF